MIMPCCKIETFTAVTLTVCLMQFFLSNKKNWRISSFYLGSQKRCIESQLIKQFGLLSFRWKMAAHQRAEWKRIRFIISWRKCRARAVSHLRPLPLSQQPSSWSLQSWTCPDLWPTGFSCSGLLAYGRVSNSIISRSVSETYVVSSTWLWSKDCPSSITSFSVFSEVKCFSFIFIVVAIALSSACFKEKVMVLTLTFIFWTILNWTEIALPQWRL